MLNDNNNNELLKINMSTLASRWLEESKEIYNLMASLDSRALGDMDIYDRDLLLMYIFKDAREFMIFWTGYAERYGEILQTDITNKNRKIEVLEARLMTILEHNRQLIKEINELKKEREDAFKNVYQEMYDKMPSADELLAIIKEQKETLDKIKSKFDAVDNIVNKVDKNKGFFINQEAVKEKAKVKVDRQGENAPAFKKDIDNSEIEKDIKAGMKISELADRYGMTYQGMKYRVNKIKENMEVVNNE